MSALPSLSCTPESVRVHGKPLELSAMEFVVLHTMVCRQTSGDHDVTTHQVLQDAVAARFPKSVEAESNVLQVMVSHLRKKLRQAAAGVQIKSVRGVGYALVKDQAVQP